MTESNSRQTEIDHIIFLQVIYDVSKPNGIRIQAWYLLLEMILGFIKRCQSLQNLLEFPICPHYLLTEALSVKGARTVSDMGFRCFDLQGNVTAF